MEHLCVHLPEVPQLGPPGGRTLSHRVGTARSGAQQQSALPVVWRLSSDSPGVSFLERMLQRMGGGNILQGHAFPGNFYFRPDAKELLNIFQLLFELEKFLHFGDICPAVSSSQRHSGSFLFSSFPPTISVRVLKIFWCAVSSGISKAGGRCP